MPIFFSFLFHHFLPLTPPSHSYFPPLSFTSLFLSTRGLLQKKNKCYPASGDSEGGISMCYGSSVQTFIERRPHETFRSSQEAGVTINRTDGYCITVTSPALKEAWCIPGWDSSKWWLSISVIIGWYHIDTGTKFTYSKLEKKTLQDRRQHIHW